MNTHTEATRRIGLLGGSFNPAHQGHRDISLAALDALELDAIWWLVTPGNPLKELDDYAPYDERLIQARKIASHPDIVISDFEQRHSLQYTVETLERLQFLNPNIAFVWLMGADSLAKFHRWKDWRKIAQLAPFAIFSRPGYGETALASEAALALGSFRIEKSDAETLADHEAPAWVYIDDVANPISSTAIRRRHERISRAPDLTAPYGKLAFLLDTHPDLGSFDSDVIDGLSAFPKNISPKYFYDENGSTLFQKITQLDEYYPTRMEKEIFLGNAAAITDAIGSNVGVFEYGSGASEKIEWLLTGLANPAMYIALDISRDYLIDAASEIANRFDLPVGAICADFQSHIAIPDEALQKPARWLGFFPGSTIGNMTPDEAAAFLIRSSDTLGPDARMLIGVDLEKDATVLNAAYNDSDGLTARFNLNLLARIERELGAKLTMSDFEHFAFYNEEKCRIEMHIRALCQTEILIGEKTFSFEPGETLHTENSHKYSIDSLKKLFKKTPWRMEDYWTDKKNWFAACLLRNN